ncbi:MAG: MbnP family protein [Saprospiraceae bacterium]
MKHTISISILALLFSINAFAQKAVYLTVKHKLGVNSFAFNQAATNDLGNNLSVTRIDYYMSNFAIIHDGGQILNLQDTVMVLAKGSKNVVRNLGTYDVTDVEGIKFSIGVPQKYNHTDPSLYGPLNPLSPQSPSMQWGWTAGYRFVAIEGKAGSNLTTNYQMHGLGDANYFSQTQMVPAIADGDDLYINLDADYTQAVKGINVTSGPIDHGVNATDLTVLQNFRDFVFSEGTGLTNSINSDANDHGISVYPNPSKGDIYIENSSSTSQVSSIEILDYTGKSLSKSKLQNATINKINIPFCGMHIIVLRTDAGEVITQKVLIE